MTNPVHSFKKSMQISLSALALSMLPFGPAMADSRTVETAFGPVDIEGQPQRVVTLYEGALDATLAVGGNAVGAVITRGGSDVAEYIKSEAGSIAIVGAPAETNIEAVIAARPDLILAPPRINRQQVDLLSRIAPVVASNVPLFEPDSWEREPRLYARALGREAEGENAIARVRSRIDEVAQIVQARIPADQRDATLVRWMPQGPLVMAEGLFSAALLQAVGFELNDNGLVKEGRPHSEPLSLENLSSMDQNWIFLATLNEDGKQALSSAQSSPAFARLNAVQKGQVINVDGQLWTSATGPLAALAILDDIEAAVNAIQP